MKSIFSERLKKERIKKGLTQQQLADLVNSQLSDCLENTKLVNEKIKSVSEFKVSRVSISRYETGSREPEIDILYALADALEVQIDYLLGRSEHKRFDSQIMQDDISWLIEKTDNTNNNSSKLIRNIIDTTFLTIHSYVDDKNIEALQIIHDLYKNIWDIKITSKNNRMYNILLEENFHEDTSYFEELKEKNNILLNKLYESILRDKKQK
ncbi:MULTISPECIES: helix-turn-helix domain-containing protein [Clostridium]|uniref:helix-turn-helix domain-containing protein n=1 Tax=Clostridium TaxID=1485 RepID=UPI00069D113A|nr:MULTISPECIES: helix-turn-helix transcriptional regulator [Clostridium]